MMHRRGRIGMRTERPSHVNGGATHVMGKAGNMGYGRTFYADEPEDLAYLRQLAKERFGDAARWPELKLRIYGRPDRAVRPAREQVGR